MARYAALTDLMTATWSGMTTKDYKRFKELKKENLRDNMTNIELILSMLAEATVTEVSMVQRPFGFSESAKVAARGAEVAKTARMQIEDLSGRPATSRANAKALRQKRIGQKQ
jgi:hypothetical protein